MSISPKYKNIISIISVIIGASAILFIIWSGMKVIGTQYKTEILPLQDINCNSTFDLSLKVSKIQESNLLDSFPYQLFLDSVCICNFESIQKSVFELERVFPNSKPLIQELMVQVLTSKLEYKIMPSMNADNLDSLIAITMWALKFDYWKDVNNDNSKIFKITYRYWMNFISNKLSNFYENNTGVKYDFKYRFLVGLCQSQRFAPSIGNTESEKVVSYFTEQKWGYLFNRFWHGTGNFFKIIAGLFIVVTLFGYYCIFKIFKSTNK